MEKTGVREWALQTAALLSPAKLPEQLRVQCKLTNCPEDPGGWIHNVSWDCCLLNQGVVCELWGSRGKVTKVQKHWRARLWPSLRGQGGSMFHSLWRKWPPALDRSSSPWGEFGVGAFGLTSWPGLSVPFALGIGPFPVLLDMDYNLLK